MSLKDLLGIANDAPLDNNRGSFWRWVIFGGVALVGAIALLAVVFHFVNQYTMHTAKVEAVQSAQSAPVALPDVVKIDRIKPIAKPTSKPTVKVPAAPNVPEVAFVNITKPDEPLTQFDRDLANFESKL